MRAVSADAAAALALSSTRSLVRALAGGTAVLSAATLTLAGCSRGVDASAAPAASDPACIALASHWPATVGGLTRRDVVDEPVGVAAWGDPAVIARCGVTAPSGLSTECLAVDGVDWVVESLTDGRRLTTYGTEPALQVLVPAAYAPETLLLPAFGALVAQLPSNGRHCL